MMHAAVETVGVWGNASLACPPTRVGAVWRDDRCLLNLVIFDAGTSADGVLIDRVVSATLLIRSALTKAHGLGPGGGRFCKLYIRQCLLAHPFSGHVCALAELQDPSPLWSVIDITYR